MSRADRTHHHEVRGLRLAWHEWGDPEAPAVLCLHGFLDHGHAYAGVAGRVRSELRVIAPDMRGHGESDWVGAGGYYHFYDYYHDVRRLFVRLGDGPMLVMGHSMGGSIATGIAALVPERVRGLVLLEGMGPSFVSLDNMRARLGRWVASLDQPAVDGDVEDRRAARRSMAGVEDAARRLRLNNPRLSEARALELAVSLSEPAPDGGVVWRSDPLHRTPSAKPFLQGEAEALWRGVKAPTLSLLGVEGFYPTGLPERHALLDRVCVGWVPGAGHNLHHERPEVVAEGLLTLHQTGRAELPRGVGADASPRSIPP